MQISGKKKMKRSSSILKACSELLLYPSEHQIITDNFHSVSSSVWMNRLTRMHSNSDRLCDRLITYLCNSEPADQYSLINILPPQRAQFSSNSAQEGFHWQWWNHKQFVLWKWISCCSVYIFQYMAWRGTPKRNITLISYLKTFLNKTIQK